MRPKGVGYLIHDNPTYFMASAIGLLGEPVGVIVGAAAGAATGRAAARWIDMGLPDEHLKGPQDGLQSGSSALVVFVNEI